MRGRPGAVPAGLRGASLLFASWPTCPSPAGAPFVSSRPLSTRPGRRRGGALREDIAREGDASLSPNSLPQLDWGFVASSVGSLSSVFLDMVLPDPSATGRGKKKQQRSRWSSFNWYASTPDVAAAYRRSLRESGPGPGRGRLVRGIIYEMSSLMVPLGSVTKQGKVVTKSGIEGEEGAEDLGEVEGLSEEEAEKLRNAELARKDWQGYLMKGAYGSSSSAKKEDKEGSSGKGEGRDKGTVTRGITLEELSVQLEEDQSHAPPSNRFGLNRSSPSGAQSSATVSHRNTHPQATAAAARTGQGTPGLSGGAPPQGSVRKSGAPEGGARAGGVPAAVGREKAMEELLGGARGEAIRAKYAGRLQEKQMLADARMQQGTAAAHAERMGWLGRAKRAAKDRAWLPMPGGAGILRHFKERLLHQSLLVTKPQSDLLELTDDMGGFSFDPTLQNESKEYSVPELEDICRKWGINPKEVIVVLGTGQAAETLLQELRGSPFFVCHLSASGELKEAPQGTDRTQVPDLGSGKNSVGSSSQDGRESSTSLQQQGSAAKGDRPLDSSSSSSGKEHKEYKGVPSKGTDRSQSHLEGGQGERHNGATGKEGSWIEEVILCVMGRIIPGFEHVQYEALLRSRCIHFDVEDMLDLKNVVEDLNGISYRTSTFVRVKAS